MAGRKEAIGIGTVAVVGFLLWLIFRERPAEAAPPPEPLPPVEPVPPGGEPRIRVVDLGFEGSPQTPRITKNPGDSFAAVITVQNDGGAGNVEFRLVIGNDVAGVMDEHGRWQRTVNVPVGRSEVKIPGRLARDFPAGTWDAEILIRIPPGTGRWRSVLKRLNVFTVRAIQPRVRVLELAWL